MLYIEKIYHLNFCSRLRKSDIFRRAVILFIFYFVSGDLNNLYVKFHEILLKPVIEIKQHLQKIAR